MIHGFKGRCPAIRRSGIGLRSRGKPIGYFSLLRVLLALSRLLGLALAHAMYSCRRASASSADLAIPAPPFGLAASHFETMALRCGVPCLVIVVGIPVVGEVSFSVLLALVLSCESDARFNLMC